jgi:plastocyanin
MKPTDELRYSTIDSSDVWRKWRIKPSKAGQELLLMRFKVENHVAVNTVVVFDEQAAVLGDYFENDYRPISVNRTVMLDQRGQGEATVTVADGECTDHARLVVNAGTNVQWTNRGESGTAIQFGAGFVPGLGDGLVQIAPGASISHRFNQAGTFNYECSGGNGSVQEAQILVEPSDSVRGKGDNILFLEGSFDLPRGTSLDGWMIFEIPKGTEIKNLRWRAGDSIIIRF